QLQEQQQELENFMNSLFKGVFVHRYRDVVPSIRSSCLEELGYWMQKSPATFLTDGHLKYLGWTLYDKQGEVRLCCVKALQALYSQQDLVAHVELFTSRFKDRLVAMALDKEVQVAIEVVKLLTLVVENMEEALTDADCNSIYSLVFVANRSLAVAAGGFLYRRVLDPERGRMQEGSPPSSPVDSRIFFRLLVEFFIQSELHEHPTYLVDALWDCAGCHLRDWDTLSALLLEEGLPDQQEKVLVEVLAAAASWVVQGPPVGRHLGKKV
ncbi:STAG3 protein, partial [Rhinopomastus cyanomelas]|nr:STAG3 protein [Rhinopomastus cyanomelas]